MQDLLKEFSELSSRKYIIKDEVPNYAYTAGYYESVLMSMYRLLSKKDQQHFELFFKNSIKTLKEENTNA